MLYGDEAEHELAMALAPQRKLPLAQSLLSSGLLQQDVIREVLEDKPSDRYEQLASVLGLTSIAAFPTAARRRADRYSAEGREARSNVERLQAEVRRVQESLRSLNEQAASELQVVELHARATERLAQYKDTATLETALPVSAEAAQQLRLSIASFGERLSNLARQFEESWLTVLAERPPTDDDIAAANAAVTNATQEVQSALAERQKEDERLTREREVADRMMRLAVDALPLLGDHCPVCEQEIEIARVRTRLQALAEANDARLVEAEVSAHRAQEALVTAQARLAEAQQYGAALDRRLKSFQEVERRRQIWISDLQNAIEQHGQSFRIANRDLIESGNHRALQTLIQVLREFWFIASDLATALGTLTIGHQIGEQSRRLAELEDALSIARERASELSAAEDQAKTLQRAAVRAASAVTTARFAELRPILQDVYSRLAPHPTFTELWLDVDVYREKGIASPQTLDTDEDIPVDPLLVFSSAQANIVALSAFLAIGWAAGKDAMPFLLLDDPLQSLDDVNALGFADLCRHMRERRQLIVSTHDRRLAGLLQRKLAPRRSDERTAVYHFAAWGREGPIVESETVESQVAQGERRALRSVRAA